MALANSEPSPSLCIISLGYLLRLRLGALAGQALAYGWVSVKLQLALPIAPLLAIGLGLLGYSLWVIRRLGTLPQSAPCSLLREAVIDLASIASAVYLTGGAHNPLVILLLLPVMVAAATLQPRLIWGVSALAVSAYSVLMRYHQDFPTPHHGTSGFDLHVQGMWYAFILSALLIAYFVAQMGGALRDRDRLLAQVREEALVDNSPTGIGLLGEGRLSLVNPGLARILDQSREVLLGTQLLDRVHPEDRARVASALLGGVPSPAPAPEVECRLITASGQVRWVALRQAAIQSQGQPLTLVTFQDLTEHKRMEGELRDLSARLLLAHEQERQRVARDLHDGPCQTLSAVRLLLEEWLRVQPAPERRAAMAPLRLLGPTLQDAAEELRRISMDLRPAMLDDLGLLATLRWYLGNIAKLHPTLEIRHHLDLAESDIPPDLRTPIFRILQEAVTNAAKHSGGRLLDVGLSLELGEVRLAVTDDGGGLVPNTARAAGAGPGLGLSSMRERATLSGGALSIQTRPDQGTTVAASWPLASGARG